MPEPRDGWTPFDPSVPTPMPRCADFLAFAVFLVAGCTVLALVVGVVDAVTRWWR